MATRYGSTWWIVDMTEVFNYLCIDCPLGCRLEVEDGDGDDVEVRGFTCKKGKDYGKQEHRDPRRMMSTTVRVTGGVWPKLPVRTASAVPKDKVHEVCRALRTVTIPAPVKMGHVVVADILETGVDIIATRDMPGV